MNIKTVEKALRGIPAIWLVLAVIFAFPIVAAIALGIVILVLWEMAWAGMAYYIHRE